jgi:hypothetical protein
LEDFKPSLKKGGSWKKIFFAPVFEKSKVEKNEK